MNTIITDVKRHRSAEPKYISDTTANPTEHTYGEFHIYRTDSPVRCVAHLVVATTPPRRLSVTHLDGASFWVPAILGIDASHERLDDLLATFPEAPFVACHYGVNGRRAWRLYFRHEDDCASFGKRIGCRQLNRNAWFYADAKDRIT